MEDEFDFETARGEMVESQIAARGVKDEAVLRAMANVPRHDFVIPSDWDEAYEDHPIGIGCKQTISQPYIVAYMTEALAVQPGMKVLEIGTGSGYQTAILAEMGAEVFTIERHEPLSEQAEEKLDRLGYAEKISFLVGDGTLGWPEEAPFDRIIVTAAAPHVPQNLCRQLADGGRMVVPVGEGAQNLDIIERAGESWNTRNDIDVIFVPLIGEDGFSQ